MPEAWDVLTSLAGFPDAAARKAGAAAIVVAQHHCGLELHKEAQGPNYVITAGTLARHQDEVPDILSHTRPNWLLHFCPYFGVLSHISILVNGPLSSQTGIMLTLMMSMLLLLHRVCREVTKSLPLHPLLLPALLMGNLLSPSRMARVMPLLYQNRERRGLTTPPLPSPLLLTPSTSLESHSTSHENAGTRILLLFSFCFECGNCFLKLLKGGNHFQHVLLITRSILMRLGSAMSPMLRSRST